MPEQSHGASRGVPVWVFTGVCGALMSLTGLLAGGLWWVILDTREQNRALDRSQQEFRLETVRSIESLRGEVRAVSMAALGRTNEEGSR